MTFTFPASSTLLAGRNYSITRVLAANDGANGTETARCASVLRGASGTFSVVCSMDGNLTADDSMCTGTRAPTGTPTKSPTQSPTKSPTS